MDEFTPTKIDIQYAENKVFFSICDCSLNKKHSFYKLTKEQAVKFVEKLKHIEKMTWSQFSNLDRKKGLTVEKSSSESYKMIHDQNSSLGQFAEKYYFHFRVEQNDLFRIFGYQQKNIFYITHIDPKGNIHH